MSAAGSEHGLTGALLAGLPDDPFAADPAWNDDVRGELVLRDGVLVRVVVEDEAPSRGVFGDEPFDEAWYRNTTQYRDPDTSPVPDPALVLPATGVPVMSWPEDVLRHALHDAPGVRLARVIAEAIDLDNTLHGDPHGGAPTEGAAGGPSGGLHSGALGGLSDDALGDLVTACGRMQSWMAGVQAMVVAERAARESHVLAHNSLVGQVTAELVVTEREATQVVVRAESGARHPSVITALVAGRIDVPKAQVLLRSATQLTVAERAEAIARYLPHAPRRTWRWLQHKMLAFAEARHGAARTAEHEAGRRCVQLDRAENAMGWLTAYLPAIDAAAVWGVVDDMAHQLRHTTGEERTLGQLRADSLTGIITGRLLPANRFTTTELGTETGTGTGTGTEPAPETGTGTGVQEIVRPVRITPTRPVIRVTVPATALLNLDDAPGHLDGYGPIPADIARTIATDATWQRLLTDPVTGILTDYSTTTYQPSKTLRNAIETRDGTCTFLGGCDTPATRCDLDHIEPFDHGQKNKNKRADKDGDGDRGNGRGQTSAQNLHALCRKHHLLKTHAGWGLVRDPGTGITTWTTPTGRTHTRPPTVLDTHVELDQIDPDTSHDLTLRALTGRHLPRQYTTTEPGTAPTSPTTPTDSDEPPF
ncbi:HNH endonuclease [Promicromonospora vindobonensis]|uniref:HNH endonuclease n=1 Tax=Promicromonospora vindobonensis TaxID=195748 RepID=A0ABW5VV57_9MICO